jgi:pullulanase
MASKNYFEAYLKNDKELKIVIPKSYNSQGCKEFYLYDLDFCVQKLVIDSVNETTSTFKYTIKKLPQFKLGRYYTIMDDRNIVIPLDCSCLMRSDKYIGRMHSDKEMGAIYTKKNTTFRVFSPIASGGFVMIHNEKTHDTVTQVMNKDEKTGVLEAVVNGDFAAWSYLYFLEINGQTVETPDPCSKAVTVNSKRSVIVDPKLVEVDLHNEDLKPFGTITDAVICELSVRDATSDPNTLIVHKGKYLGLAEEGVKTLKGNPVGLDYLKELGVTHIQILPVFDFQTTNDLHPQDTYNWGYDPLFYNAVEGGMASNPLDPLARIVELKTMIGSLHKNNIRVVMDVVFNHVFNMETSPFEKACPNYYFRYTEDGYLSNGSFCGNEFESRHLMARKFIVDSCKYWVKEFGIDGLRFDLMGLLDTKTILEVYEECKKLNKDFILYGEGWDMPTVLAPSQKASMNNAFKLENIGFFNDRYRDIAKGKTDHDALYVKGYLTGDTNYIDGFKHVFLGSSLPLAYPPLFKDVNQSINYVECHDNNTIFDKLEKCCYDEDEITKLKRIKLINALNIFSFGVPFFHLGQEIGLSKDGDHNSYRSGDKINSFKYNVLDERSEMFNFFKDVVKFKKKYPFLRMSSKDIIDKGIEISTDKGGVLKVQYIDKELISPFKDVIMYVNPTKSLFETDLNDYYQIIFNESGEICSELFAQHLLVNPLSVVIVVKK